MRKSFSVVGVILILTITMIANSFTEVSVISRAERTEHVPEGKYYIFGENPYSYDSVDDFEPTSASQTYGVFKLTGDLEPDGEKDGVSSYILREGSADFIYAYDDSFLNAEKEAWHLTEDKEKNVLDAYLPDGIKNGAIILEASRDGKNWLPALKKSNLFKDEPANEDPFYSMENDRLMNGIFFRLIIAYEVERKTGENNIAFIKRDVFEYERRLEEYKFYLHVEGNSGNTNEKRKLLGEPVSTGKDNGYSGSGALKIGDAHYGWELGNFFVSGYSGEKENADGVPVFLKNVGDKVTLGFNLKQDLDRLNDDEDLIITEDINGYDEFFQTDKTNMGRGALIVRYTDYENHKTAPEVFTNYLAANAIGSADTVVQAFEEGDYEVALDYEIKKIRRVQGIETIPEYSNYRIFFKFSVRNSNCMVYPFDLVSGTELTNESYTPNGFRLDMARSRYLDISVTRSVITSGVNGYVEDVRAMQIAKDGDQYKDEGVYTFTVKNRYTDETVTKRIYVGESDYIKALSMNNISVDELNEIIEGGGSIAEDGPIVTPTETETEPPETTESKENNIAESTFKEETESTEKEEQTRNKPSAEPYIVGGAGIAVFIILAVVVVCVIIRKKKR